VTIREECVKGRYFASLLITVTLLLASSSANAITTKAAGRQYLNDVASADAALNIFDSQVHSWTNSTADTEGEHEAATVLEALRTLRENLLSQDWPQFVKGDVRFIGVEDISSLEEDLREIDSNSSLGNGAFQLTFSADSRTMDSDAFYVRKKLGLPISKAL
jgi:hypothetical protein